MFSTFAIVGGGTSGITFLGQLVDRLIEQNCSDTKPIKIVLFEKDKDNLATGLPYSAKNSDVWLLNGPPAKYFKLLPDGKTLEVWMKENVSSWQNQYPNTQVDDQFPPRSLIGLYFKDQYAEIKKRAKEHDIIIEEYYEKVIDVIPQSDSSYEITTENNNKINTEKVILCFGHLSSDKFQNLVGKKNYIASTWDPEAFKQVPKDEKVYIIGGHLSFIDAAKELVLKNHFLGELVCVTRNPNIMMMRNDGDDWDPKKYIQELEDNLNQNEPQKLSWSEFTNSFWKTYQKTSDKPVTQEFLAHKYAAGKILSYQLSKKANKPVLEEIGDFNQLKSFVEKFATGSCYSTLWKVLDNQGKEEFSKHFFSLITACTAGIPEVNARFLVELYDNKRIKEKIDLESVSYDDETQEFVLKFKNSIKRTKFLINATGAGHDISLHQENALLQNLVKRNLIRKADKSGFIVNDANIFAINPSNYFDGKPGLSAVFAGCMAAQQWIDKLLPAFQPIQQKKACYK